jgi:hypothetical protein
LSGWKLIHRQALKGLATKRGAPVFCKFCYSKLDELPDEFVASHTINDSHTNYACIRCCRMHNIEPDPYVRRKRFEFVF